MRSNLDLPGCSHCHFFIMLNEIICRATSKLVTLCLLFVIDYARFFLLLHPSRVFFLAGINKYKQRRAKWLGCRSPLQRLRGSTSRLLRDHAVSTKMNFMRGFPSWQSRANSEHLPKFNPRDFTCRTENVFAFAFVPPCGSELAELDKQWVLPKKELRLLTKLRLSPPSSPYSLASSTNDASAKVQISTGLVSDKYSRRTS